MSNAKASAAAPKSARLVTLHRGMAPIGLYLPQDEARNALERLAASRQAETTR